MHAMSSRMQAPDAQDEQAPTQLAEPELLERHHGGAEPRVGVGKLLGERGR